MPIPDFDDQTGYLPAGDHSASLDEMEQRFCGTLRRREIFKELKHVVEQLEAKGVDTIWIGGSFVTDKERPGDVDVIYEPPPESDPAGWGLLSPSRRKDLKKQRRVDLWKSPSPQPIPGKPLQRQTIKEFFGTDKDGVAKGFIQLSKEAKDDPK
jgi:hypothetical protein